MYWSFETIDCKNNIIVVGNLTKTSFVIFYSLSGPGHKRFIIYSIFGWILPIGMNVIVIMLGMMDHVDKFFLSLSGSKT